MDPIVTECVFCGLVMLNTENQLCKYCEGDLEQYFNKPVIEETWTIHYNGQKETFPNLQAATEFIEYSDLKNYELRR
jgi:hypothetical protein